jgi:hypothetical protein
MGERSLRAVAVVAMPGPRGPWWPTLLVFLVPLALGLTLAYFRVRAMRPPISRPRVVAIVVMVVVAVALLCWRFWVERQPTGSITSPER